MTSAPPIASRIWYAMFEESRFGNTKTFASSFSTENGNSGTRTSECVAGVTWISPSISSSGRRWRAICVASRTLRGEAPPALPKLEYESIATRGTTSK